MSDYGCEAGSDSVIEAHVLLPNKTERKLVGVQIMDINGTDFTVAEVKATLLEPLTSQEIQKYKLAFKNEDNNQTILAKDDQRITDFMDELQSSQFTIIFRH